MRGALTGTRIRERRLLIGMRQSDLARAAGVSPAYLNLIEHNRRRPGPDLVAAFARELGVETRALDEGSEDVLSGMLREAALAAAPGEPAPEIDRLGEFAARFPGWSALLAGRQAQVERLERLADRLSDRLAHDPQLSAQVHELLTTITALRSAAAILAETPDIDGPARQRFQDNIAADSLRLSEAAAALVAYLDASPETGPATPQDEVEAWLAARGWSLAEAETGGSDAAVVNEAAELRSPAARELARAQLARLRADAALLPLAAFRAALAETGPDPVRLAARFSAPVAAVMRRLATLPAPESAAIGLLVADGSGALTFRKPVAGLALPRFGAGCPLWPLYAALSRPGVPSRALLDIAGRGGGRFLAYAIADLAQPLGLDGPEVVTASMLLLPDDGGGPGGPARAVGLSCRVCPRTPCPARREPSILVRPGPGQEAF